MATLYRWWTANSVQLETTSVIDNIAFDGGGLALVGSTASLTDCVVEGNMAMGAGGGAFLAGGGAVGLVSMDSSWGMGASDNVPNDVEVGGAGSWSAYGDLESFVCDAAGCI